MTLPNQVTPPVAGDRFAQLMNTTRRGRCELRNETGDRSATMWLYGTISRWWGDISARDVARQLADLDVDDLTIHLHSPGGDAFEGIAIFNTIRNHAANVTIRVDGVAASAASVVAMAGDTVIMGPGSQLMIHDAWMGVIGNATELRSEADWLDAQSDNLASIYAWKVGGTAADWRALMKAETWYSAEEAVAAGLADAVADKDTDDPDPEGPDVVVPEHDDGYEEAFDLLLSSYRYPGRAQAPAPAAAISLPAASAPGSTKKEGGAVVDLTTQHLAALREQVGFAEDADADTIVAATVEALTERADTTTTSEPVVPEGMSLIEDSVLDELRTGAAAGIAAREEQRIAHRDQLIDNAIRAGKFAPARRDHWVAAFDADPTGTETTIAALASGLIPVEEEGHDKGERLDADEALWNQIHGTQNEKEGA